VSENLKFMKKDILESSVGNKKSFDVICLSHLRWDFVYQRPQHLLSRFARERRVFFFEEPIFSDGQTRLEISPREDNLFVVQPHISNFDRETFNVAEIERELLEKLIADEKINDFVLWFYTPMAMDFAAISNLWRQFSIVWTSFPHLNSRRRN
jgi:ribonuclease BN (tRNA processing enzyme)